MRRAPVRVRLPRHVRLSRTGAADDRPPDACCRRARSEATMTDGIPQAAIEAAYAEFCRVYPQRCAPWDQLAEWERDRFRLVLAAAVPLIRADMPHEHRFRHCDDCKSAPGPCACAGQPCCQAERDEIAAVADAYERGRADE